LRIKALGGPPSALISIENAVDHSSAGEKPEPFGRQGGTTGAKGRESPRDGGEVIKHSLAQERLTLAGCALEAEDGTLSRQA
jgi:hypothetical protein